MFKSISPLSNPEKSPKNISPPKESPRLFDIQVLFDMLYNNGNIRRSLRYYDNITDFYLEDITNNMINDINKLTFKFPIEQRELYDKLRDLSENSRDGDIMKFGLYRYFIYGKGHNRKFEIIVSLLYPRGALFPVESLNAIKHYSIHELKDVNKH